MYPVSDAFKAAVTASHRMVVTVDVYNNGSYVTTLPVVDGSVTVDMTAAVRRTVTLTVPTGGALVPGSPADVLAPYGNELRVSRGIHLTTADELVPLGRFSLDEVAVEDTPTGLTVKVTAFDQSVKVQRNQWTAPYTITGGSNVATAVRDALKDRLPLLVNTDFNFVATASTVPADVVFGTSRNNDPWKDITGLATSIGCELFFDPLGQPTLRAIPDPSTSPVVWTYAEGANATITKLSRALTRAGAYNGVIVTGEGPDIAAPVRAEAWDTTPSSPTYYLGSFGKVPYFYTSPLITTVDQAQTVATSLLRQRIGGSEQVSFGAVVNPAHDASDVVRVTRSRSKVDALYVLKSLTIPLGPGTELTAATQERAT